MLKVNVKADTSIMIDSRLSTMQSCFNSYDIEIDSIEKKKWEELLLEFDDASFSQTWSMGAISFGEKNLSHLVLIRDGQVLAMAQISIRKLPIISAGVARLFWGPLWRRKGRAKDYAVLDRMIEALKAEYVTKRGLLLRIWPIGFENSEEETIFILKKHGFIWDSKDQPYRTLILSLTPPIEELTQNLVRKWRQALTRAERFPSLDLEYGTSNEHYTIALNIYNEMYDRKKFLKLVDMKITGLVQKDLPAPLKMKILICRLKGEPIAALGWSTIGDTGLPLIAATSNKALSLSTNANNLLWWNMVLDMKIQGCKFCDVGGINPELNLGGYKFKLGLVGNSGRDVRHLGQFFLYRNPISYFLKICIDFTNFARTNLRGRWTIVRNVHQRLKRLCSIAKTLPSR